MLKEHVLKLQQRFQAFFPSGHDAREGCLRMQDPFTLSPFHLASEKQTTDEGDAARNGDGFGTSLFSGKSLPHCERVSEESTGIVI
jgi:hypothetical protein